MRGSFLVQSRHLRPPRGNTSVLSKNWTDYPPLQWPRQHPAQQFRCSFHTLYKGPQLLFRRLDHLHCLQKNARSLTHLQEQISRRIIHLQEAQEAYEVQGSTTALRSFFLRWTLGAPPPPHVPTFQSAYCRPFRIFGLGGFGSVSLPTAAWPERTGTISRRHKAIPAPITKSELPRCPAQLFS